MSILLSLSLRTLNLMALDAFTRGLSFKNCAPRGKPNRTKPNQSILQLRLISSQYTSTRPRQSAVHTSNLFVHSLHQDTHNAPAAEQVHTHARFYRSSAFCQIRSGRSEMRARRRKRDFFPPTNSPITQALSDKFVLFMALHHSLSLARVYTKRAAAQ